MSKKVKQVKLEQNSTFFVLKTEKGTLLNWIGEETTQGLFMHAVFNTASCARAFCTQHEIEIVKNFKLKYVVATFLPTDMYAIYPLNSRLALGSSFRPDPSKRDGVVLFKNKEDAIAKAEEHGFEVIES